MSVLPAVLNSQSLERPRGSDWRVSEAWRRLMLLVRDGAFPHTIAISAPAEHHLEVALSLSKVLLCEHRVGEDGCLVCESWSGEAHPDLIVGGEPFKPPAIEECREMISSVAFRPVLSSKRVALVFAADRMLPPAANSLLKLAEEPPDGVHVVFMLEDEKLLLPTLKSRSWMVPLPLPRSDERFPPPRTEREWADWIKKYAGAEVDELSGLFAPWITYEIEQRSFERAALLERLRNLVQSKRLSKTMALDLIVLVLKEGFVFEHSFGDLW